VAPLSSVTVASPPNGTAALLANSLWMISLICVALKPMTVPTTVCRLAACSQMTAAASRLPLLSTLATFTRTNCPAVRQARALGLAQGGQSINKVLLLVSMVNVFPMR
jgi:hypothetical protein